MQDLPRFRQGVLFVVQYGSCERLGYKEKFVRPDYDIIIGPIADNTLQNWFNKIEEDDMSFCEVASRIQYTKFKDNQYAFCSARFLKLLKWVDCHDC